MRLPPNGIVETKNAKHTPAANTAAVVTLTADEDHIHVIKDIWWSYGADPTNGEVNITAGGTEIYSILVTNKGPGHIEMNGFHNGTKNEEVVVTATAGGSAISCTLNVQYR